MIASLYQVGKITMATIQNIREELPEREGQLVEIELAHAAFALVRNQKDWKAPVDAKVDLRLTNYHPEVFAWAIGFMTATPASWTIDGDTLRVRAAGYRAGPAGDH